MKFYITLRRFFKKANRYNKKFDLLNVRKCSKKQCYEIKKIFFEINNKIILNFFYYIKNEIFKKKNFEFLYIFFEFIMFIREHREFFHLIYLWTSWIFQFIMIYREFVYFAHLWALLIFNLLWFIVNLFILFICKFRETCEIILHVKFVIFFVLL